MKLESGRKYLWQWELNQRLEVPEGCTLVHFDNGTTSKALSVEVKDGFAEVPNCMLQVAADIRCYAWDGTTVVEHIVLHVEGRPMPAEYVYTETEVRRYDILLEELEKKGAYYTPAVDAEGNLSWEKSMERMPDVPGGNIRGPKGEQGPEGPQGPQGDPGEVNIDDAKVGADAWSSKNILDKLCPAFSVEGAVAICDPVEGYPLEVVSTINPKESGTYESISLTRCGKNLFSGGREISFTSSKTITLEKPIPAGTYFISMGSYTGSGEYQPAIIPQYADGTDMTGYWQLRYNPDGRVINPTKPITKVRVWSNGYSASASKDVSCTLYDIQIEAGSVATPYAPYQGQTLTADFTNAPEMEGKGDYNWNTGLLHNGASAYLHDPVTGAFTMIDDEEASAIIRNIPALPGTNYIYSDCGDTQVKGRADLLATINQQAQRIADLEAAIINNT